MRLFGNRNVAGVALVVALLVGGAAHAQDLASAHHFVAAIYAHYPTSDKRPSFDPTGDNLAHALFDASLVRLIREDERLAHGEVGVLDSDPFCDCQDDGGMKFTVGEAKAAGPSAAKVDVMASGSDLKTPERLTVDLIWTPAGWRVHDIHTPNTPSLRGLLVTGIADEKKLK
jgi:hypothetical protein